MRIPPVTLPAALYAPDLSAWAGASANIRNVVPRTPESYGPVGQPAIYSSALTARCQGGAGFIDSGSNVFLFAGDSQDLYKMVSGSVTWSNVSKSLHAYGIGSDSQWQFVYFNGDVIATDFVDQPQMFTLASSVAFADLTGSPPRARYISVVKNAFVVLGNTFDGTNGNMPQRVWWSAAGNAKNWPTPGTNAAAAVESGATDLLGDGGWVQGFASGLANADAVVFQQYAVKRMSYAGPPLTFAFLPAENVRGTQAPNSIVVNGGLAYYYAQDGFYSFDGVASQPIGANRVDKTVGADIDQTYLPRMVGTADPFNKLIWWAYPGAGSSSGNPNRLLAYSWQLDRWSICDITCETIMRMLSIGYTLDELFTILGYTLDNLPAPLDSPIWTGGKLQLGIFDTAHKLNYLSGTPLAATIETAEIEPASGKRVFVSSVRPQIDGVGTAPTVKIGRRDQYQDAVAYGPDVALNSLGNCPQRLSGNYIRATTTVPAGSSTWTNVGGVEIDIAIQGIR